MNFLRLFRILSLSYFSKHRFKILFAILGMSTGIAIYVTTGIYKDTIYYDVQQKEKLVQQSDKWIILSENGRISEGLIPDLADIGVFKKFYPKSETFEYILNDEKEPRLVKFVGVDLLRIFNPQGGPDIETTGKRIPVIASEYFTKGDIYRFKKESIEQNIEIVDVIEGSSDEMPLVITDISVFQSIFSDQGFIDQLEVELLKDLNRDEIQNLLQGVDSRLIIQRQNKNIEKKQSLSDAFLVNLQFFSIIALIISVLLIYQFYRFILIEREKDFSKLKSIGMSNRNIFSLLLFELVLIGTVCGVTGLCAGLLVSKLSLGFIVSTVDNFYYNVDAQSIYVTLSLLGTSVLIGILGCILAGIHPVLRFTGDTSPVLTTRKQTVYRLYTIYRWLFAAGFICLFSLFYVLNSDTDIAPALLSFSSVTIFTVGVLLILPLVIKNAGIAISKLKYISALKFRTSLSYINQTLVRQCFYVLSLGILIGFVISLVIFIASFRQTITNWIEQVTPADVYIQSAFNSIQQPYPIPDEVFEYIVNHPMVDKYDYISRYRYSYKNTPLQIRSSRFEILKEEPRLRFKSIAGSLSDMDKSWVFISEPFQKRYGKNTGDTLTIHGDRKSETFTIMGVFYDYVSEKGTILVDISKGKELFSQRETHGTTVYNLSKEQLLKLERDIKEKFPGENLVINSKKQLRDATLKTFDRTFYIVWFLAIMASLISVVTLINSSSMVFLERLYEFSQLRAVGASTKDLLSMLWSQMGILSLYSIITAFICSIGFINIIDRINWAFFGWSIEVIFDWKPYVLSFFLLFLLTYLTVKIPFGRMVNKMKLYGLRND